VEAAAAAVLLVVVVVLAAPMAVIEMCDEFGLREWMMVRHNAKEKGESLS